MGLRKKILIGVITAAGIVLGTAATLAIVRNSTRKPVGVYKVSDVAQTDYWADQQETYGNVSADQIQNVFLSGTQTVSEIFVQEGQTVNAGDPLLAYDTTLSGINIERAENDLNQQKRTLELAQKELTKMQKTKPLDEREIVVPGEIDGTDAGGEFEPDTDGEPGGGENDFGDVTDPESDGHADAGQNKTESGAESQPSVFDYHLDTNYQGEPIGEAGTYDTPELLDGIGTIEKPAIWIWGEDDDLSDQLLRTFFNTTLEARQKVRSAESESVPVGRAFSDSDQDCYLVLRQYMENNPAHRKIAEYGLHLELKDDRLNVSLFNPDLLAVRENGTESGASSVQEAEKANFEPADSGTEMIDSEDFGSGFSFYGEDITDGMEKGTDAEEDGINENSQADPEGIDGSGTSTSESEAENNYAGMTKKELSQAISDQKIKIRDQEIVCRLAEVKLRQMKHELSDGIVRSTISGTVKMVRDPETAFTKNKACISVTNGGGYRIRCAVSELSLSGLQPGMAAEVISQESGNMEEGSIVSISDTPASESEVYGFSNNPNVSYYSCIVQVPDTADLKENEFVSVAFGDGGSSQKGLFLDSMFIRSDDKGSYVYLKGDDKLLKKQYIRTGRDIGGGTMEVLSGLTLKDRIAFPYGTNVTEGVKTKNSTLDELYS